MKRACLVFLFAISACVGDIGPMGIPGAQGQQGVPGEQGPRGDTGLSSDPIEHITEVMARYEEAVLLIHCESQDPDGKWEYHRGSGIKLEDGTFMTAAHVAAAPNIKKCVIYDVNNMNVSSWFEPANIQIQPNQDVAVVSGFKWANDYDKVLGATIDTNYQVKVGELVGLMSFPHSLTGFVVYTYGHVAFQGQKGGVWEQFGTDLVLFQGSSGGPVFNMDGNVIGLAAANYPDFNFDITYVQALRGPGGV